MEEEELGIPINQLPSLKKLVGNVTGKEHIPVDLPLPIIFPSGEVIQTVRLSIDELCDYIKAKISSSNIPESPTQSQTNEPVPQNNTQQGGVGWYKPIQR